MTKRKASSQHGVSGNNNTQTVGSPSKKLHWKQRQALNRKETNTKNSGGATVNTSADQIDDRNNLILQLQESTNLISLLQAQLESANSSNIQPSIVEQRQSQHPTSSMNYRMKCPKFYGNEDEDFDVWFDDVQAFFELNRYNETEKVTMIHAHLGGDARKFMHGIQRAQYETVDKFYKLLKDAFSERIDWNEALTNCKQKPEEKIKTFALRLKVCARKCNLAFDQADKLCLSIFRQNSNPQICRLLRLCMPGTSFDQAVDHAIQFERQNESRKRKWEQVDNIEEISSDEDKDIKTNKKPNMSSKLPQNSHL